MNAKNNYEIMLSENEISLCIEYTNIGIITINTGNELKAILIIMLSQWYGPFDHDFNCLYEKYEVDKEELEANIVMMSSTNFDELLEEMKLRIIGEYLFRRESEI